MYRVLVVVLRERLRWLGWRVGLLAMALSLIALPGGGGPRVPAYLAAAATVPLCLCAPPAARRLAPFVLAGIGLLGIALALSRASSPYTGLLLGGLLPRASAWRASLILQSGVFLAAGLWLLWRARDSRLGRPALGRPPRWGLLLPPAAGIAVLLVEQGPGHPAWIAAAAAALIALIAVLLFPAAAPDLAAAGLMVLGLCALAYVVSPPDTGVRALTVSPNGLPHGFAVTVSGPLELLAGVQAAAILALGLWLVPRTIGVHAKVLLRPGPDPELAGRVRQLTQTRADAVDTAATELRRVERDLHDGAQARLVALGMSLRAAERLIPTSPQAAIALVAEARESSSKALTELRDLVRGVYPPVLADRGLADAVRALALDTPVRTETDIDLPGRLEPPVESACYFAIAEALTNAVKHSGARLVQIRIRHAAGPRRLRSPAQPSPGMLRIEVTDNGTGGADPAKGGGLAGVERRLGTFDGILAVSSPPGGPTMIVMEVPCALSSQRTSSC
jgi:signal transduction histidine kinase